MASFPECTICRQAFKWKGPDPYLLPCLHAICETCKTSSDSLHCSTCQRDVDLKTTRLMKDQVRMRLIFNLTARCCPTEVLCTHKDDDNSAISWCPECGEFFCDHCQKLHDEFKVTRTHTVQNIREIGTFEYEADSYCRDHKNYALELFDHTCKILICLKCKQESHSGHLTENMETYVQSSREKLRQNVEDMNDVKNKTGERLDENSQETIPLKENASTEKEKIKNTFDTLREMIDKRQKEITSSFDMHLDKATTAISSKRKSLTLHQNISSIISEYAKIVLHHGSKSDLSDVTGIISDEVKECIDSNLHQKITYQPAVLFLDEDLNDAKSSIAAFSDISYYGERVTRNKPESQLLSNCALQQDSSHLEVPSDKDPTLYHLEMEPLSVKCVTLKFSSAKVNTDHAHVNKDGELCNKPVRRFGGGRMFQYMGTSSTEPLTATNVLQYWETSVNLRLQQMIASGELILEIGICWQWEEDQADYIRLRPNSYSMAVKRRDEPDEYHDIGIEIRKEGDYVRRVPLTLQNGDNMIHNLRYGTLFDSSRKKIAFLDLNKSKVLAVLDVFDITQPMWPMFGVLRECRGSLKMKLVDGEDISMTKEKKFLITKAMC